MTITPLSEARKVRMADDWYSLATNEHFWIDWRYQKLLSVLQPFCASKFYCLDIGCGNGATARRLETDTNFTIDGCELNAFALEQAVGGKGKIFSYDIMSRTLADKGYDLAILLDVLEHIESDREFLCASTEHLCDGGLVLINVPALPALFSRYDTSAGHLRRYTRDSLSELLKTVNLEILHCSYWGFPLVPVLCIRKYLLKWVPEENVIRTGFQPPSKILNSALGKLASLERTFFPEPFLGTSLVALARRS